MTVNPTIFDVIRSATNQIEEMKIEAKYVYLQIKDYRKMFPYTLVQIVKFQIKRNKRLRHKRR